MARLKTCRACLERDPIIFMKMGDHPPANAFIAPERLDERQPTFPLDAQVCLSCGLIEVADNVPADFFRNYLYVPSAATRMSVHFAELADHLVAQAGGGLIVDVGCNDGLLLSACRQRDAKVLGIDPAANLAVLAKARGVPVVTEYFKPRVAAQVRRMHGPASVIVTTNTFNHIDDLHEFMSAVVLLLARDGRFVIEAPWAKDLVEKNEFDTIYHEHVSEFSLLSIKLLAAPFGLEIADVERSTVHGGSLRTTLRRSGEWTATPAVAEALAEERASGMLAASTYVHFVSRVDSVRDQLRTMLAGFKAKGLRVAGYGAPAKGCTLLHYFDIGPETLEFLVDRSPLKQGLYSPGKKIPIVGPEAIAERRPDVLLVLAWNFFDEIREQQRAFLEAGGRFLVPLPQPVLIGLDTVSPAVAMDAVPG